MVPRISQLAYVGFRVADLNEWRSFGTDLLGLEVASSDGDEDVLRLRMDERAFRIELSRDESESLERVGWEVPLERDFEIILDRLSAYGVKVIEGSADVNSRRHYARTAAFVDPSGIPSEIAYSPIIAAQPYASPRPSDGFVAGELGLGHLFLYVEDVTVATSFYCDVLGFEVTDYIVWPEAGIDAVFLRCNARHHSIALGKGRPDQIGTLEHIMLEARSIDDVGRAMDAVIRAEVPLFSTLGRHINDRMLSFYACAPSGILVEYGCDALQVPNGSSWGVKQYTTGHTWGHNLVGNEVSPLPFRRADQFSDARGRT